MSARASVTKLTQSMHEGSFDILYTLRLMHAAACFTESDYI